MLILDWGDMMRYGLLRILWGRQSQLTPNIPETKPLYVGTVHWNSWGDEVHLRYVVPTGRYVVPAGKVIIIVSTGRLSLVPTGRVLSPGRVK
ncbi:hypothetical protein Tco_1339792 [Tanacetum coccineum]